MVKLSLPLLVSTVALLMCHSHAFTPASRGLAPTARLFMGAASTPPPPGGGDDLPEETGVEYTGSVDWDAEWKKVVQSGGTTRTENRPGKDYYKSEAEIAAIRAANAATEKVNKVASSIPALPSWNELKGDWRFWIGVLALLSVGTSLLAAAGSPQPLPVNGSPDSYYI